MVIKSNTASEVAPHSYDIQPLSKAGVQRWFEVGPKPDDAQAAIGKLNAAIAAGTIDPDLRLVALKDGIVIARFAARIDYGRRFYFWLPSYGPGLSSNLRSELARSFLNYFENSRAMQKVKFLETKPADDLPHLDEWLATLNANGFREISCAYLFDYDLDRLKPHARAETHLRFVSANSLLEEVIDRLIQECDQETLDRLDAQDSEHPSAHWDELKRPQAISWNPALSHVALADEQPAGLILAGREPATGDGWILFVGVVPRFRRQHIGTQLLDLTLHSFQQERIKRARALIDDVNVPSIRLHEAAGFQRQAGRFMTYRKLLLRES